MLRVFLFSIFVYLPFFCFAQTKNYYVYSPKTRISKRKSFFLQQLDPAIRKTINTDNIQVFDYDSNVNVVHFYATSGYQDRIYLFQNDSKIELYKHICLNGNLFAFIIKGEKNSWSGKHIIMNWKGKVIRKFIGDLKGYKNGTYCQRGLKGNAHDHILYLKNNKWGQGRYGLLNANASSILPPIYTAINVIGNHWFKVRDSKEKFGVISKEGKEILALQWDEIFYQDSIFVVIKNLRRRLFTPNTTRGIPTYRISLSGNYYAYDFKGKLIPNSFKHMAFTDRELVARNRQIGDYLEWFYNKPD